MTKPELAQIINQLVSLGEDQAELNIWLEIFDYLEPAQQTELELNLSQELEALKSSPPTA